MQSDVDIFIWIIQGIIGLLIAAEALLVSMEPQLARRHRRALWLAFAVLFSGLFGLIVWQGERNLNARRQGDSERQTLLKKSAQERYDLQAAFDRQNQDSQIERDRSQKERNGLKTRISDIGNTLKFVADTIRAQTLNGQKLNALVSQSSGEKQIAELNNNPSLPTVADAPPANPDQMTLAAPKHLAFTSQPVLSNGVVVRNLYFFQPAVESTAPNEDTVLSWDFGDGKPVTSRATERVLHAFSDEHPYRPGQIQVTVIGTVPRK